MGEYGKSRRHHSWIPRDEAPIRHQIRRSTVHPSSAVPSAHTRTAPDDARQASSTSQLPVSWWMRSPILFLSHAVMVTNLVDVAAHTAFAEDTNETAQVELPLLAAEADSRDLYR